jgi:glutaredoxin 3
MHAQQAPVVLYKAGICPYCSAALRFLREVKKVTVHEIDLTGDDDARVALMHKAGGRRTVPQIWVGQTHVGGYDDLRALDAQGGLDPLLVAAGAR